MGKRCSYGTPVTPIRRWWVLDPPSGLCPGGNHESLSSPETDVELKPKGQKS